VSSRLTWCADERAEPDWIAVGMTIRMVMSDAEDRSLVRRTVPCDCESTGGLRPSPELCVTKCLPMARRFALREEPGLTPLIDIQGCERSNRERSDEAVFPVLVVTL
jgi:hypothetical protein